MDDKQNQNLTQIQVEIEANKSQRIITEALVRHCDKCNDTGSIHPRNENGSVDYSRVITCECQNEIIKKRQNDIFLKMCDLPPKSEQLTFKSYEVYPEVKDAYTAAVRMVRPDGNLEWLTLIGGVDCGKTHLAVAICRVWIAQGKAAKYAYVPIMLDELRSGMGADGVNSYDYRFNVYCSVPLLVLDDLGVQSSKPWVQEKLDTIVDYRYMNQLPLVVTSNLTLKEMPERIASRLQRYGKSLVVDITAKEYRLRK
jgi:DNA replication protein DnaC